MRWRKDGRVFQPDGRTPWMASHASVPVPYRTGDGRLRVTFAARDAENRSRPGWVELDPDEPLRVLAVGERPLLELGRLGTFDDNGVMPSWAVEVDGALYLYYIGWNPQVTVSYRVSIGLAVSRDGGATFARVSEGPIMDRAADEPFFCTTPCVLREGRTFKMWFTSCTGWELVDGRPEPRYTVRYAESTDGIRWQRAPGTCLAYADGAEAFARPCVFAEDGVYRMIYSSRSARGYRDDPTRSYRLGFAESRDGLSWERQDDRLGLDPSPSGWDSDMVEYAALLEGTGRMQVLYNGNGFGRTGFGLATRIG